MEVTKLIPKDKGDEETAKNLMQYSYEEVETIIPQLLEWIQDGHWPVAEHVANFLKTISPNITTDIIGVLKGIDDEWQYQCIHIFGFDTKDILLRKEIERIASNPTEREIEGDVQIAALEAMESWQQ